MESVSPRAWPWRGVADADLWDVLRAWANAMSWQAQFDESIEPQAAAGSEPQICFAPMLILRRRTESALLRAFGFRCGWDRVFAPFTSTSSTASSDTRARLRCRHPRRH